MFKVGIDEYSLTVHRGPLPLVYGDYRKNASLADEIDLNSPEGEVCFVSAGLANRWPSLVVAQRFSPSEAGFSPGVLLVPETEVLFIGAGVRLLAYSLDGPARLWEDSTDAGFWCWNRHGGFVLMSGELELAAWDLRGRKLWSRDVEPPWTYEVENGLVDIRIEGFKPIFFPIASGPPSIGQGGGSARG